MKLDKRKITKCILVFLGVMLIFTLITNKVNYMMTPEVMVVMARPSRIGFEINLFGTYENGNVTFNADLNLDNYISKGNFVFVRFANHKDDFGAEIINKDFDSETQSLSITARVNNISNINVYDEQHANVSFFHTLGNYNLVLPRSSVIREGNDTFVYLVQTVSSVTGKSDIVVRRNVTIIAKDEFNVAIEGGLHDIELIVAASSKPLRNEMTVRISN